MDQTQTDIVINQINSKHKTNTHLQNPLSERLVLGPKPQLLRLKRRRSELGELSKALGETLHCDRIS